MQTTSRYRLRWWLVYWWLAGCVLVNTFALIHGPLSMTTLFIIVQVVPSLLGGAFALWIVLLFINKAYLGVWLTRWQYVLCLLALWMFGLSPTLFVYSSSVWVAAQTLQTIESRYEVIAYKLERGPDWSNDVEWGPGLRGTWDVWATVKPNSPRQFVLQLASDLEKHGWEGGSVTETHYGFQCSNMTIPRIPFLGLLINTNNVFHVWLPEDERVQTVDEVEIYFSFDAVNPFSSQCRL